MSPAEAAIFAIFVGGLWRAVCNLVDAQGRRSRAALATARARAAIARLGFETAAPSGTAPTQAGRRVKHLRVIEGGFSQA